MTALVIVLAGLLMIGLGVSLKRLGDRMVDEILAAEQRQIARERRQREYDANLAAKWRD